MATVHQGLGDRFSEAPASSVFGRRRRRGVKVASGLPWILPALVLCVGLIYYCIGYTGLISTWNWDGISPNPQHVGFGNYTQLFHDPLFWGAVRHTVVFFAVTFTVQTFLGLTFAVLLLTAAAFGERPIGRDFVGAVDRHVDLPLAERGERDAEFAACIVVIVGLGLEDGGVHAEIDIDDIGDAPLGEECAERR